VPSTDRTAALRPFLETACAYGPGLCVRLYAYLWQRILRLPQCCVSCDNPHVADLVCFSTAVTTPSVCRRDRCAWSFLEMGVGRDSTDEVASSGDAQVVNLLLETTKAAALSARKALILCPFPLVRERDRILFDPAVPDYGAVGDIVRGLPSIHDLTAGAGRGRERQRHGERPYTQDLCRWITNSCPAQIGFLGEKQRIASLETKFQFLLRSSSLEREQKFSVAKKKYPTVFAFHGSRTENWHRILREGIRTMSGKHGLQLNGAVHGPGVYLSPSGARSLLYSSEKKTSCFKENRSENMEYFQLDPQTGSAILALCEVIDDGRIQKHGDIWVAPDDHFVETRFLFVFPSVSALRFACTTTNQAFQNEIKASIFNTWGEQWVPTHLTTFPAVSSTTVIPVAMPTTVTPFAPHRALHYLAPDSMLTPAALRVWLLPVADPAPGGDCTICLSPLDDPRHLVRLAGCGHTFHRACLAPALQVHPRCPVCRQCPSGTARGHSPSGDLLITRTFAFRCAGFGDTTRSIVLTYRLRPGVQKAYHPNPGQRYEGTTRIAYLPENQDGESLLKRLEYAWTRGLTFDVGKSLTTGRESVITWASIHHKTSSSGSSVHGFPDPRYFINCNEELDTLHIPKAEDI